jgi:hypothetical protein
MIAIVGGDEQRLSGRSSFSAWNSDQGFWKEHCAIRGPAAAHTGSGRRYRSKGVFAFELLEQQDHRWTVKQRVCAQEVSRGSYL